MTAGGTSDGRGVARAATGYCALIARRLGGIPRRALLRRKYARRFGLEGRAVPVVPGEVAALIRIKNEDFWIEPILRVVSKVFSEVVVIDSGSEDRTLEILDRLREEGLRFQLFRHREPPHRMMLIANVIVDHRVRSEWIYLVDGDEVQLESSCRLLAAYCRAGLADPKTRRLACQQLLVHPSDILRCTPPLCPSVRYMHGRAYRRRSVRLNESGLNDGLVATLGFPGTNNLLKDSVFLDGAWILHCALSQRSTIPTYRGFADLLPRGGTHRMHYRAADSDYVELPAFPKEIEECRYSGHNHYLRVLAKANVPLV